MSSLILLAGTASAITVNCSRLGKNSPRYIGGRTDSNQGNERSTIRGQKKVIPVAVAPVDTATEASIQAAAYNGAQIPCSGDILGNIQTLCSLDVASEMVPGLPGFFTMTLTIYEVYPSVTLLRYAPGDSVTGETFTRATTAFQCDANGIYVSKAINTKRDGHYIGGVRSILLEEAKTNSLIRSNDMSNAAWTKVGTGTSLLNAVGLDGTANSASTLTDSDAAAVYTDTSTSVVIANDNTSHAVGFWVKADAITARFVGLKARLTGGTVVSMSLSLNTQTGAVTTYAASAGTVVSRVTGVGLWWLVEIILSNNTTGNVSLLTDISPAIGTVFGVSSVAATGSTVIGQVQVELGSVFITSPIITAGATVTRGADTWTIPFTTPPQELSVYTKFIHLGTEIGVDLTALYLFGGVIPNAGIERSGSNGLKSFVQNTAATGISGLIGTTAALGDTEEVRQMIASDGSSVSTKTLNSGTESASATSGTLTLPSAWSTQNFYPNGDGAYINRGFVAFQSIKIIAGARSLAELRAA